MTLIQEVLYSKHVNKRGVVHRKCVFTVNVVMLPVFFQFYTLRQKEKYDVQTFV